MILKPIPGVMPDPKGFAVKKVSSRLDRTGCEDILVPFLERGPSEILHIWTTRRINV